MRLGPSFWHFVKERSELFFMLSISPRSIPSPLGQNSEKFSMLLFRGGGSLWGCNFLLFMEECTVLYLMVALSADRSQACSARSPRNFQFHFSVGESSYGPNFLVFSEIALGALPYVFNVTSLDAKSARPDLRENFNLTFQGGRVRVVPIFLNVIKERMVFYLIVFNFSSLGPKTSRQLSE